MEAYQQHYMGAPPPPPQHQSPSDPNLYPPRYPLPARPPQVSPPQNSWYANQYHYQPPPSGVSPPLSMPQHHNWAFAPPVPHGDHVNSPLPPYPPQQSYPSHFPPPHPPPHQPQISHSYLPPNQEWQPSSWGQQQGWGGYSGHNNNAEDWGAKAKAWAAAKKGVDQQPQPFVPLSVNSNDQIPLHNQQYNQDVQPQAFPVGSGPSRQALAVCHGDLASLEPVQSFPSASEHLNHQFDSGNSARGPTASLSVLEQEVPSSYSSVAGNYENKDQVSCTSSNHHPKEERNGLQPSPYGKVGLPNHSMTFGDQLASLGSGPRDQSLNFVQPHHEQVGTLRATVAPSSASSFGSWTPNSATVSHYPPIQVLPPVLPHDPNIMLPSITGNAPAPFGSYPPVSNFQSVAPPTAPYGIAAGPGFAMGASFPGDAFGAASVSDRPRKASVPNWLKEEIIKKASVITRSTVESPKVESSSIEDDEFEKSIRKGDQKESKSFESNLSSDEEDENYVEAARTATINQEIKRVLTEVLLKVTDELFDEIANKVLDEDPHYEDEVHLNNNEHKIKSSVAVQNSKVEGKIKGNVNKVDTAISISSHGNLLGLANYDSDDNDDEANGLSKGEKSVLRSVNSKELTSTNEVRGDDTPNEEVSKDSQGQLESIAPLNLPDPFNNCSENVLKQCVTHGKGENVEGLLKNDSSVSEIRKRSVEKFAYESKRSRVNRAVIDQDQSEDDVSENADSRKKDENSTCKSFKTKDANGKGGEQGKRMKEKLTESNFKRINRHDVKEDQTDNKCFRYSAKEGTKEIFQEKHDDDETVKHKKFIESRRHKRRYSPPGRGRNRNQKDQDSSDEYSDDSKRDSSSRKRHSYISSVRSRERRSPSDSVRQRNRKDYDSSDEEPYDSKREPSSRKRHAYISSVKSRERHLDSDRGRQTNCRDLDSSDGESDDSKREPYSRKHLSSISSVRSRETCFAVTK